MSYRDDRDARAARADALERELNRARADAQGALERADELAAQLKTSERERKRLARSLRAASPGAGRTITAVAGVMILVLAGLGAYWTIQAKRAYSIGVAAVAADAVEPVALSPRAQKRWAKLAAFQDCRVHVDYPLRALLVSYRASLVAGVPIRKWYGFAEFDPARVAECRAAVAAASEQTPVMLDLERQAAAYLTWLASVEPLLTSARRYHMSERFEEDGFAWAREVHGSVTDAIEAFAARSEALHRALDAEYAPAVAERLALLERRAAPLDGVAIRQMSSAQRQVWRAYLAALVVRNAEALMAAAPLDLDAIPDEISDEQRRAIRRAADSLAIASERYGAITARSARPARWWLAVRRMVDGAERLRLASGEAIPGASMDSMMAAMSYRSMASSLAALRDSSR